MAETARSSGLEKQIQDTDKRIGILYEQLGSISPDTERVVIARVTHNTNNIGREGTITNETMSDPTKEQLNKIDALNKRITIAENRLSNLKEQYTQLKLREIEDLLSGPQARSNKNRFVQAREQITELKSDEKADPGLIGRLNEMYEKAFNKDLEAALKEVNRLVVTGEKGYDGALQTVIKDYTDDEVFKAELTKRAKGERVTNPDVQKSNWRKAKTGWVKYFVEGRIVSDEASNNEGFVKSNTWESVKQGLIERQQQGIIESSVNIDSIMEEVKATLAERINANMMLGSGEFGGKTDALAKIDERYQKGHLSATVRNELIQMVKSLHEGLVNEYVESAQTGLTENEWKQNKNNEEALKEARRKMRLDAEAGDNRNVNRAIEEAKERIKSKEAKFIDSGNQTIKSAEFTNFIDSQQSLNFEEKRVLREKLRKFIGKLQEAGGVMDAVKDEVGAEDQIKKLEEQLKQLRDSGKISPESYDKLIEKLDRTKSSIDAKNFDKTIANLKRFRWLAAAGASIGFALPMSLMLGPAGGVLIGATSLPSLIQSIRKWRSTNKEFRRKVAELDNQKSSAKEHVTSVLHAAIEAQYPGIKMDEVSDYLDQSGVRIEQLDKAINKMQMETAKI